MDPISAVIITTSIGIFFIGIIVFFSDHKRSSNIIFSLICLFFSFWAITDFLTDIPKFSKHILLLSKLTFVGPIVIPALFFYFSLIFPVDTIEKKPNSLIYKFFIFLFPVFFLFILPSSLIVKKAFLLQKQEIALGWKVGFETGSLYFLLIFYAIIFIISSLIVFWKNFLKSRGKIRSQLKCIFIGVTLTVIFSLFFGFFLPVFFKIYALAKLSIISFIFLLFATALSITRYYLFNIKVILSETLVGIIALLLFFQLFIIDKSWVRVINVGIFLLFCIFGYLLIRSVLREIKLKEELEAANKELKRLDEAKTEFLSIASHQLRTPLTAIKGYIGMIEEGIYGGVPEKVKEILEKVNDSNERLIRLVNSLLDISRLELGRMEFEFEKVDIEEMLENIVDEFHIAARKKGLKLVFEHPKEKLPEITIDALKMRQVFLNLVDNAIKYTYEGEIIVKAELKDHGNERIRVSVSDTGMGIARNEIDQIFKIYRRGTGVRLFPEGSGVGLYVAKKIVEAHNGKIWVKSQGKGRGSTFYVEIPVRKSAR